MTTSDRQTISVPVQRDLLRFYRRKRCVVGGTEADWHHLDEDPANSVFENLVPLGHSPNGILSGLDRTESRTPFVFTPDLLPERLISRAQTLYYDWDVAGAYGCSRLAVFIGRKYAGAGPLDLAQYAVRCLWYSRHRSEQRLFRDVLLRDLLPLLEAQHMDALTAITVLHECASFLSEFGKPREAEAALGHLSKLLPNWKDFVDNLPFRLAGLVRREALIEIGLGGNLDQAFGKLKDSEQLAPANLAAMVGAANARAWSHFLQEDYPAARDAIGHLLDLCLDKMFAGSIDPKPIAIPLAMAAELVLIEYSARRASEGVFTDQTGQKLLAALFGLSQRAVFTVPLVSPSMAQSDSIRVVLEDFKDRGAGDWTRPDIDTASLKAVQQTIEQVRVRP